MLYILGIFVLCIVFDVINEMQMQILFVAKSVLYDVSRDQTLNTCVPEL